MKRVVFVVAGVLCVAGSALAQPPAAGQPVTVAVSLSRGYNNVKLNLTEEAAKMPEADYTFKPGPAPELRNFGMLFGHVANAQFGSCATALGQPNPNQGHNLEMEAEDQGRVHQGARRFIRALRQGVCRADGAECERDGEAGTGRDRPCGAPRQPGRAQQRDVRHRHRCTCARRGWCRRQPSVSSRCRDADERVGPRRAGKSSGTPSAQRSPRYFQEMRDR